jgi:hypothetical protein
MLRGESKVEMPHRKRDLPMFVFSALFAPLRFDCAFSGAILGRFGLDVGHHGEPCYGCNAGRVASAVPFGTRSCSAPDTQR